MPGTITLRPLEANLTHNTDLLTKMNPYCVFVVGTQRFNSQICKKGGKHPVWNDEVTIPLGNENKIMVEVMDKDKITKDDIIGSFMFDVDELTSQQHINRWYPLFYKNKPAGEILMDANFRNEDFTGLNQQATMTTGMTGMETGMATGLATGMASTENVELLEKQSSFNRAEFGSTETTVRQGFIQEPTQVFTEQRQTVEPHTFMKEVEVVETRPVIKEVEVLEPRKVVKDVEVTEAVPVRKQIETIEPQVVKKNVEVIEPRLVTKEIQVVENIPVMKEIEVIEQVPIMKEVETFEPQTFHKQVTVTEQVPVKKQFTVTEPITLKKPVEFVEPIITTKTITKEVQPAVVVDERITQEVGPASVINVREEIREGQYLGERRDDTLLGERRENQFRDQNLAEGNLNTQSTNYNVQKSTEYQYQQF